MSDGEARAWRLLQAIPDPVIVADAHGVIELVNAQAVVLFGYQPEELVGQSVELLIPAELHEVHRRHRLAYVATDEPSPMSTGPNIFAVRKDGSTVPVEVNLSSITLSTGRAVLASIRDVSERKQSEARLRISDERFRVSFDKAPIGMALIDLERASLGQFLRVNQALCILTGYSEIELLSTTSPAITHPEDRAETTRNLARLAGGTEPQWSTEKRYRTAAGNDIWVHFTISVVRDVDEIPSYGVSQVEDITDRKRAEARLSERFTELATNVEVGFLVRQVDPPKFLYFNPAYLRIFGLDPDGPAPTPQEAMSWVNPEDAQRVAGILPAAVRGERAEATWRFTRRDGQQRWVSARVSPIRDPDGHIRRVAGIFEDITERKSTEDAIWAARAEAERANAAKNEFLSGMSHELRTPLNAILGFGQLIQLDDPSSERQEWVEHILKAGRHLLGLIDEILDIARMEAGSIRLSLEPVDVREVVHQTVGMLTPLAEQHSIRIEIGPVQEDCQVVADHQRLKQVLLNLLSNAVKYNHFGGAVRISCEVTAGVVVRLSVEDDGIGIAEADLSRLFRPFERFSAAQSTIEGTGLGLALTKRLVDEMGGKVGVRSSIGEGSCFWVEFAMTTGVPRMELPPPLAKTGPAATSRTRTTLLYIEDNLSNVRLLEQIVSRRPGVDLLVAMQGQIGLDMATMHSPALILLDLHLPDIAGEEVLRRLRSDPRTARTPVVILSADATVDQSRRLISLGASDYLTKPFDIPRVLALIDGLEPTGPSTEQI